jgi:hypothetical protein
MEMREAFLGEKVERQRNPRWVADSARSLAQRSQMMVRILARRRLQQFRREPEHALLFVCRHQLRDYWFEIGEYFDLRQRCCFDWVQFDLEETLFPPTDPLAACREFMQTRGRF